MVKLFEGDVYLEPIKHIYYHRTTGDSYSSVTQLIHSLVNPFDEEGISKAISKRPDEKRKEVYRGMSQEQILDHWQFLNDEANEYGTRIHELIEDYLYKDKLLFTNDTFEKEVLDAYDDLNVDEGICVWPERIMFSEEHKLAGTADLKIDIDDTFFDLGDWKTNGEFDFFDKFGFKCLKKPLDHLQDCHYSIYTVQLSIYAYMCELETGMKCRQIWIGYWDRESKKLNKMPIMYLKHEAKKILDLHKYRTQFN